MKINQRYKELLLKYAKNEEIFELLDLVVLDNQRENENYFITHNTYPSHRDLLGKLKMDLSTTREFVSKKG